MFDKKKKYAQKSTIKVDVFCGNDGWQNPLLLNMNNIIISFIKISKTYFWEPFSKN